MELCSASLDQCFLVERDPKKYKGPLPPDADVLLQLAKGLEYIHSKGYTHNDVKVGWFGPESALIRSLRDLLDPDPGGTKNRDKTVAGTFRGDSLKSFEFFKNLKLLFLII